MTHMRQLPVELIAQPSCLFGVNCVAVDLFTVYPRKSEETLRLAEAGTKIHLVKSDRTE